MAVQELSIEPGSGTPPPEVSSFLDEVERRIDHLFETEANKKLPRYIPSDPLAVYHAIDCVTRNDLPLGRTFVEWGSGFGAATGIAALLGYDAYGIEIEPSLVAASRELLDSTGVAGATIVEGSYLPDGYDSYAAVGGEELVPPEQLGGVQHSNGNSPTPPSYSGMDFATDEVDVFFVFPWPGEQQFMQDLFHALAGEGSILLSYLEDGEVAGYQKVADEGDDW